MGKGYEDEHEARAGRGQVVAHADDERILAHLKRHLGEGFVFHELVSERVHVDVHVVPATRDRPFHVLVTSGMSALPMTVPDTLEDPEGARYAELCLLLPPTWQLDPASFKNERHYWPIRLLKVLARLPHDHETFLDIGHSIPNGDPAEPYAPGTQLTGAVLIPPLGLGDDFYEVEGEPPLRILQVLPVTDREMALKLDQGTEKLLELLEARDPDIYGPIDPRRRSAV